MMMRAEAPAFEPNTALAKSDFASDDTVPTCMDFGWAASPVSTHAPSPWMSPMTMAPSSPWSCMGAPDMTWMTYQDGTLLEDWGMPELNLDDLEPVDDDTLALLQQSSACDDQVMFKLEGLSTLQGTLVKLLEGHTCPGDTSTTVSGDAASCESPPSETQELSTPRSPGQLGIAIAPPPGLEMFSEAALSTENCGADAVAVHTATGEDNASDEELPPLPARAPRRAQSMQETSQQTTLILQNIPKKCSRSLFEKRLEEDGFMVEVDFLYLPIELKSKSNVGHAVLNFRSEEGCKRFTESFDKIPIKKAFPGLGGKGLCSVSKAKEQGKDVNVQKLRRSAVLMSMLSSMPEWMPQIFDEDGNAVEFPTEEDSHQ